MPISGNIYQGLSAGREPGLATLGDFFRNFQQARDRRDTRAIQQQDRQLRQQEIDLRGEQIAATKRKLETDEQKAAAAQAAIQRNTSPEGIIDYEGASEALLGIDPEFAKEFDAVVSARAQTKRQREKEDFDKKKADFDLETARVNREATDLNAYLEDIAATQTPEQYAEVLQRASENKMLRRLQGLGFTTAFTPEMPALASDRVRGVKGRDALERPSPTVDAPFTLSPGSKRFGPDGKVIAEVPPSSTQTGAGFTLPPGATRYDADGQPVATAPQRPPQGAVGRPVTSGDANRIADFDTSLDDLDVLEATLTGNQATGTSAKVGAMLPNAVTDLTGWGTEAKQKQAVIDRVKQVIGKALEGGVLRKEDEYKYEKILPTIADTAQVVASKLGGLRTALDKRRATLINSLEDAGYDMSRYQARPRVAAAQTPGQTIQKEIPGFPGAIAESTDGGKTWKRVK